MQSAPQAAARLRPPAAPSARGLRRATAVRLAGNAGCVSGGVGQRHGVAPRRVMGWPRGRGLSLPQAVPVQQQSVSLGAADTDATRLHPPPGGISELKYCVEAQQFSRPMLDDVFRIAHEMERVPRGSDMLRGYVMATLFYEPSTRTRLSFEAAMQRLGGSLISTESAAEFSSAAKGETLEDTMRVLEGYADVIVLRHFQAGSAKKAAASLKVPLINAGDGPGQHPTQALLDVYTIQKELGRIDGATVAFVGDLANGRTVRSLAYLLSKYDKPKFFFVAPDVVRMKDDIKDYLTRAGIDWTESSDLMEVAASCDVLYQTRIQRERFGERPEDYEKARGKYVVDSKVMAAMPQKSIVMHPLPRLDEIATEVDSDPRAAYFRQAQNGLFIRMALLKILLKA